jgi:hypothetical protein
MHGSVNVKLKSVNECLKCTVEFYLVVWSLRVGCIRHYISDSEVCGSDYSLYVYYVGHCAVSR